MAIQYIKYSSIDKQKWDNCITHAGNGLIYACSFYLDAMAANWDALILNDYEAVMPLTWKKKYGIHYLYQPYFTACLGVFGKNINAETLNNFLNAIPQKFKYWDIYLNHGNLYSVPGYHLYQRVNYVLPLNKTYQQIFTGCRDNIKRNIKRAEQLNCTIKKDIDVSLVIALAKEQSKSFSSATDNDYERFTKLYRLLHRQQQAIAYGVYSTAQLVASCVFFFSHGRAYYILVGNHPNGKTIGASHALINAFIKDHAGQDLLLDFEGSDIRNLAFFYSSFGAATETYAGLKLNRLPFWIKWLKK